MKQSSKKLLALMTAGMLCAGSLGALPAFAADVADKVGGVVEIGGRF